MARPILDVTAFGADGTGRPQSATQNVKAFEDAFNAVPLNGLGFDPDPRRRAEQGAIVFIPPGNYYLSRTIEIKDKTGFVLQGAGPTQSRLTWITDDRPRRPGRYLGTVPGPMLQLTNCRLATLREFGLFAVPRRPEEVDARGPVFGPGRLQERSWLSWGASAVPDADFPFEDILVELLRPENLPWLEWAEQPHTRRGELAIRNLKQMPTAYPNNGTECARRRPKEVARDGESL
jgi:Pectate lyase superfamily protein